MTASSKASSTSTMVSPLKPSCFSDHRFSVVVISFHSSLSRSSVLSAMLALLGYPAKALANRAAAAALIVSTSLVQHQSAISVVNAPAVELLEERLAQQHAVVGHVVAYAGLHVVRYLVTDLNGLQDEHLSIHNSAVSGAILLLAPHVGLGDAAFLPELVEQP